MVRLGEQRLNGFVTNPRFQTGDRPSARPAIGEGQPPNEMRKDPREDSAASRSDSPLTAVYLPMSYQLGGFMVLLPAESLEPLEISAEDAMRLVLTAGVRSNG
jgi:hypothetical protein